MKVIVSGVTGFIGGAVLQRCLEHPSISSVIALSRREVDVKHPKLQTVIQKDFTKYDAAVLEQLKGAETCLWCLGAATSGMDVHEGYTFAAAEAFASSVAPHTTSGKPFRFLYLSGHLVERDQDKSLWFLGQMRKARGTVETKLVEFEKQHADIWKSFTIRPWVVTDGETMLSRTMPGYTIPVAELAAGMIEVAMNGSEEHFIESADLKQLGKAALQSKQ